MPGDFGGLRVLSLESRRAVEIKRLIEIQHGAAFVAPSMREIPLEQNPDAFAFGERLFRGEFDLVILLTGVGTRLLNQVLETRWPAGEFARALRDVRVVARGPKPMAVLREWNVPATLVPEPNTWREILQVLSPLEEWRGKHVAIQEFGRHSFELLEALSECGADVMPVPVYQWELPEDLGPLRDAARKVTAQEFDVVLLTSSIQIEHLLRVAEELSLKDQVFRALERTMIASIGPTTSETLRELGLQVDLEPSHPKMGVLVLEAAQKAQQIVAAKAR